MSGIDAEIGTFEIAAGGEVERQVAGNGHVEHLEQRHVRQCLCERAWNKIAHGGGNLQSVGLWFVRAEGHHP